MKIGLMIDDISDDQRDKNIADIKKQFKGCNVEWVESEIPMDFLEQDGFDLVVLDYGGISIGVGNSLSESFAKYVNEYAANHPNTFIFYVTVMGKEFLSNEGINFDDLHNIHACDYSEIRELYDNAAAYKNK